MNASEILVLVVIAIILIAFVLKATVFKGPRWLRRLNKDQKAGLNSSEDR